MQTRYMFNSVRLLNYIVLYHQLK